MIALHQNVANCQDTLIVLTQRWRIFPQDIWMGQMMRARHKTTSPFLHRLLVITLLEVSEREEGVVAIHLPIGSLKTDMRTQYLPAH